MTLSGYQDIIAFLSHLQGLEDGFPCALSQVVLACHCGQGLAGLDPFSGEVVADGFFDWSACGAVFCGQLSLRFAEQEPP